MNIKGGPLFCFCLFCFVFLFNQALVQSTELGRSQGTQGWPHPHLSSSCSMTSPSANQKVSLRLMMSCESNQRRLLAPLQQWATEGTQRVIFSGAAHRQLCPCLLLLLISILTRPLNCLSALVEYNLSDTDEPCSPYNSVFVLTNQIF